MTGCIRTTSSRSRREQDHAFYTTKAQLTRAYLFGLEERPGPMKQASSCREQQQHEQQSKGVGGRRDKGKSHIASVILPALLLSGKEVERDTALLDRLHVTHILQVGIELSPTHPGTYSYKTIPIFDLEEQDLLTHLPQCFEFMEDGIRNGKVLVHCAAGISRSASVVMAFLMHHQGLSFSAARAAVKSARPTVNPNLGFALQLQLLDRPGWPGFARCPAWDLEQFLDAKAEAGDDRTMQGACTTSAAALVDGDETDSCGGASPETAVPGSWGGRVCLNPQPSMVPAKALEAGRTRTRLLPPHDWSSVPHTPVELRTAGDAAEGLLVGRAYSLPHMVPPEVVGAAMAATAPAAHLSSRAARSLRTLKSTATAAPQQQQPHSPSRLASMDAAPAGRPHAAATAAASLGVMPMSSPSVLRHVTQPPAGEGAAKAAAGRERRRQPPALQLTAPEKLEPDLELEPAWWSSVLRDAAGGTPGAMERLSPAAAAAAAAHAAYDASPAADAAPAASASASRGCAAPPRSVFLDRAPATLPLSPPPTPPRTDPAAGPLAPWLQQPPDACHEGNAGLDEADGDLSPQGIAGGMAAQARASALAEDPYRPHLMYQYAYALRQAASGPAAAPQLQVWGSSKDLTAYDDLPDGDSDEGGGGGESGAEEQDTRPVSGQNVLSIKSRLPEADVLSPSGNDPRRGASREDRGRSLSSGVLLPLLSFGKRSAAGSGGNGSIGSRPSTAQSVLSNASFGSCFSTSTAGARAAAGGSRAESVRRGSDGQPMGSSDGRPAVSRGVPVIPLVLPRIVSGRAQVCTPNDAMH